MYSSIYEPFSDIPADWRFARGVAAGAGLGVGVGLGDGTDAGLGGATLASAVPQRPFVI